MFRHGNFDVNVNEIDSLFRKLQNVTKRYDHLALLNFCFHLVHLFFFHEKIV